MTIYAHDCDRCVSLGTIHMHGKAVDLYVCAKAGWESIIARHGNEPPEYTSAPVSVVRSINPEHEPALAEGLRRADALRETVQ